MVGALEASNRSKGAGQLMIATVLIAIAAGSASALMFASIVSGALISLLLFYLAPLPLMVAALGWGPAGQRRLAGRPRFRMVSGRAHPALDHRLCRADHHGGAAHAWHRHRRHHRRLATILAANSRLARCRSDGRNRAVDRCSGDDRPGRGRNVRYDDADAQSLARRKNHGDFGTVASPMARPEKRSAATDDARGAVRRRRVLLYERTGCDPGSDHRRGFDDGLRANGICRVAHLDAGIEKPRVLARLHLHHRDGVRLADYGAGGFRPCRRHFRDSPALPARAAAASPRVLNSTLRPNPRSRSS